MPGHGSWFRHGSPRRLFWKPWKHSFYAFFVTQPARGTATPLFDVFTGTSYATGYAWPGSACNVLNIAHFPQKSMIYALSRRFGANFGHLAGIRVKLAGPIPAIFQPV